MKAFPVLQLLLVALVAAHAQDADACGGETYSDLELQDIDSVLVQTLPNLVVKQDDSLAVPLLRAYNTGDFDSVLSTGAEDGTITVQGKNGREVRRRFERARRSTTVTLGDASSDTCELKRLSDYPQDRVQQLGPGGEGARQVESLLYSALQSIASSLSV